MLKYRLYSFYSAVALSVLFALGCGKNNEASGALEGSQIKEEGSGEKVELVLSYSSGNYEMDLGQKIEQNIKADSGQNQDQLIEQEFTIDLTVSEPAETGERNVKMNYTRVAQKMDMGPISLDYDSDSPPDSSASPIERQVAQQMGVLHNATIELTISPDGTPLKVKGMDKLWDDMAAENSNMAQQAANMKKQFGNDNIKQMWEMQALLLPSESVAPGAVWTAGETIEMPMLGEAEVSYECTLKKVAEEEGRRVAYVDFTGEVEAKGGVNTVPGAELGAMNFDQKGTYTYDIDLNMITDQNLTQEGTMEMTVQGQKMTIDQTLTQTITVMPKETE